MPSSLLFISKCTLFCVIMACKLVGFSFLLFSSLLLTISASLSLADNVTVTVRAVTAIQETDGNLVCATIDWWPKEKCDYGWCPWYNSSIINLVSLVLDEFVRFS